MFRQTKARPIEVNSSVTVGQLRRIIESYDDDKPVHVLVDLTGDFDDFTQEEFAAWKNEHRNADEPYLLVRVSKFKLDMRYAGVDLAEGDDKTLVLNGPMTPVQDAMIGAIMQERGCSEEEAIAIRKRELEIANATPIAVRINGKLTDVMKLSYRYQKLCVLAGKDFKQQPTLTHWPADETRMATMLVEDDSVELRDGDKIECHYQDYTICPLPSQTSIDSKKLLNSLDTPEIRGAIEDHPGRSA